jgi:hypothetical protein
MDRSSEHPRLMRMPNPDACHHAGEGEEVAAMERDFLKSVLAVRKLEAEVRHAVQRVRHPPECGFAGYTCPVSALSPHLHLLHLFQTSKVLTSKVWMITCSTALIKCPL